MIGNTLLATAETSSGTASDTDWLVKHLAKLPRTKERRKGFGASATHEYMMHCISDLFSTGFPAIWASGR